MSTLLRIVRNIILLGIAFILCLTFALFGLPICKKAALTEEELCWVTSFDIGDQMVYMSDCHEDTDTMIIIDKYLNNQSDKFSYDLRGCIYLAGEKFNNGYGKYKFFIKHKGKSYSGDFDIQRLGECDCALIGLMVLGNYIINVNINIDDLKPHKKNNLQDADQILITKERLKHRFPNETIPLDSIIWDRHLGLISYKDIESNCTYTLVR